MTTTVDRRRALAARLIDHDPPGHDPDPDPTTNPWLYAYNAYPAVRRLVDTSPHNTRDDVITRRLTADMAERILRHLTHG